MPKTLSAKEVYNNLATEGLYEEAHLDNDEVKKVFTMVTEDYKFGKTLRKLPNPNYRIIFNIHYDILRELCDQLLHFKKQKISNHQGLFAFIVLHFDDLAFDWNFLENIRDVRNKNRYENLDISKQMWQKVELQFDIYINGLIKEIEKRLN